jgi:hypothetical protein
VPAAPAPAMVVLSPAKPADPPAVHVQMAAQESRQSLSITPAAGNTASVAVTRSTGGRMEGDSVLHQTNQLIDKFDRPTDPNLFVLPQVKETRNQSFDVKAPALTMQSGLLIQEISPQDSTAVSVRISQVNQFTLADQTLAELIQTPVPQQVAHADEPSEGERLAQKQALHLAAARAAEQTDVQPVQTLARGQFGFSLQLQMSSAKRTAAPTRTLS